MGWWKGEWMDGWMGRRMGGWKGDWMGGWWMMMTSFSVIQGDGDLDIPSLMRREIVMIIHYPKLQLLATFADDVDDDDDDDDG